MESRGPHLGIGFTRLTSSQERLPGDHSSLSGSVQSSPALIKMRLHHLSNHRAQSLGRLFQKEGPWGSTELKAQRVGVGVLGNLGVPSAHLDESGAGSKDHTLKTGLLDSIKVRVSSLFPSLGTSTERFTLSC